MPIKPGLMERAVFYFSGVGNGQGIPEIKLVLCFYTAWTRYGQS